MIGDRCARCTGLALQALFAAQLQRLPQALTIRSCNTTCAICSKSRVLRFGLVVVTTKSALGFFTPADAVTTSDFVVNIARSQRRSSKPYCT